MQLSLMVFSVVLGVTVLLAIVGILIDKSGARHERIEGR